ncbi:MAG TPA: DUF3347 domain-containing protein [Flavisolibacter sp.]|nr:DUF3347 domain-containing protein [Flavisolibacter sp.]
MRPILLFLVLAGAGIIAWLFFAKPEKTEEAPKPQALAVSKHSDEFNQSIENILTIYGQMGEDFVNWDSAGAREKALDLGGKFLAINLEELKKDSNAIYQTAVDLVGYAKANIETIAAEERIRPQREAYNNLTDNIEQFLNTIRYDREKLFVQQCPMAFDDVVAAKWLSKKEDIRNPYLGLKDPKYGKGMLSCGETIKTINHTGSE